MEKIVDTVREISYTGMQDDGIIYVTPVIIPVNPFNKAVVFDKTSTFTLGQFAISDRIF